MLTFADFTDYVNIHQGSSKLWLAVELTDNNAVSHYFTEYDGNIRSGTTYNFMPAEITVGVATYEASLFKGSYSVRPVRVTMTVPENPNGSGSFSRFTDEFASAEFETEICTIYLGWGTETDRSKWPVIFKGRMVDFVHTSMQIMFTVIPRGSLELPPIPEEKFTRDDFENLPADIEGAVIPLVYGQYTFNLVDSAHYDNFRSLIPAALVSSRLDLATPELVFKVASHKLQTIGSLWIYDEHLKTFGEVNDTAVESLSDATITLTPNSALDDFFMTADFLLYPTRLEVGGAITVAEAKNTLDWDYDTEATLEHGDSITYRFDERIEQLPLEELLYWSGNYGTDEAVGIAQVRIRVGVWTDNTFVSGQVLRVSIENSNWSEDIDSTTMNGYSDTEGLTHLFPLSANLVVNYNQRWDGTKVAFTVQQTDVSGTNDHPSFDIVPRSGYYTSMTELAEELTYQLLKLVDDENSVDFQTDWVCLYDRDRNKMRLEAVDGGTDHIRVFGSVSTEAANLGFSETTFQTTGPAGQDTGEKYEAENPTLLDVPDGDFSKVVIKVENAGTSGPSCELNVVRVELIRKYRTFQPINNRAAARDTSNDRRLFSPPKDLTVEQILGKDRAENARTLLAGISGSMFFVNCGGEHDTTVGLYESGARIIEDILKTKISGLTASDVDDTSFDNAHTDSQVQNLILYLATQERSRDVIAQLARYSLGFVFEGQDGKYKMSVLKSTYGTSDIDHTIEPEDVPGLTMESIRFSRTPNDELGKDITLRFIPNYLDGSFNDELTVDSGQSLSVIPRDMQIPYVNMNSEAQIIANHFGGDSAAGTVGHFGKPKIYAEIPTIHPQAHLVELGDVIRLSTRWPTYKAFGIDMSYILFKVLSKQIEKRKVTFKGVEVRRLVGPDGVYLPDENLGDSLVYINFGRAAVEGSGPFYPDYPPDENQGTLNEASTSTQFGKSSSYDWVDNGGGLSSGMTPNGIGGNSPSRTYDNENTDPLHARYAPGDESFFIGLWVYEMERVGSNGILLYGVPHDTFGAKLEFGIDSNSNVFMSVEEGGFSAIATGSTTLDDPYTGYIFGYFKPGVELVVGYNGIEDGSVVPSSSIGTIHGSTLHNRRAFFFNRNSGASLQNPVVDTSILSRAYIYSIANSRFPADATAEIAKHNYDTLNGTF